MPVERFSIDEHRRVEERGAEERVPAQRSTSRGESVGAAALSLGIEEIQLHVARIDRACDVTDIIDNVSGAGIGILLGLMVLPVLRP
jgi:glycopeptide antibiotics resistance protein